MDERYAKYVFPYIKPSHVIAVSYTHLDVYKRQAVDRTFKNRDGEKDTDFIPIVTWRKTAELCEKYLSKGSMAAVIDVYKRQLNTFKTYINQERRQSEYNDTTRTKAKRLDSCICI